MRWRRLIVSFFILTFTATPVAAATRIGFIAGPLMSDLRWETLDSLKTDFTSRTGLSIGGVIDLGEERPLSLRLEPSYVQKSADKILFDPWLGEIHSRLLLSYIETPLLLKYHLHLGGPILYAVGGGWFGYLLSAEEEFTCDLGRELHGDSRDVKDEIESIDYGYAFGGGLSFPLGTSRLFLEGLYTVGQHDIWKGEIPVDDPQFEEGTTTLETGGWRLTGGITFPIGGPPREYYQEQPELPAIPPVQPPAPAEGYDGPGTADDEQPANDAGERINRCNFDIDIHMPPAQDPNTRSIPEEEDATHGSYTLVNDDIDVAPADLIRARIRHHDDLRRVQGRPDLSFDRGTEEEDDLVQIDLYNPDGLDNLFLSAFPMASERAGQVRSGTGFRRKVTRDQMRVYRSANRDREVRLPHKVRGPVETLFVEGRQAGRFRLVLFHLPQGTHGDASRMRAQEVGDPHGRITQGQVRLNPQARCHRNVRLTVAVVDIQQVTELDGPWQRQHVFDVLWGGRANLDGRLWPPGGRYQWGTAEGLGSTWVEGELRGQAVHPSGEAPGTAEQIVWIGGGFAPGTDTLLGSRAYEHRLQLQYQVEGVILVRQEPVTILVPTRVAIRPSTNLRGFNQACWGGKYQILFGVHYRLFDQLGRLLVGPPQLGYEIKYGARLRMYEALGTALNAHEDGDRLEMRGLDITVPIVTAQRSNPVPGEWSLEDGDWEDTFSFEITSGQYNLLIAAIRRQAGVDFGDPIFRVRQDVVALLENGQEAHDVRVARGQQLEILGPKPTRDRTGASGSLGFRMRLGGDNGRQPNTGHPDLVSSHHNP